MDPRVAPLAAKQNGLVTRAELVRIGLTTRQIDHSLTGQQLIRMYAGVYRIAGCPRTTDSDLAAGLLLTEGVASHRSAAHLLTLIEAAPSAACAAQMPLAR